MTESQAHRSLKNRPWILQVFEKNVSQSILRTYYKNKTETAAAVFGPAGRFSVKILENINGGEWTRQDICCLKTVLFLKGKAFGAEGDVTGEVVFQTMAMTGYLETLLLVITDNSSFRRFR